MICHKKCLSKIITDCSTRQARQVGTDLQSTVQKTNITVQLHKSTNIDSFSILIVCTTSFISPFPVLLVTGRQYSRLTSLRGSSVHAHQ